MNHLLPRLRSEMDDPSSVASAWLGFRPAMDGETHGTNNRLMHVVL